MSEKTLIEWTADIGTRFLTIHPDGSFDIDKDAPPLFVIGELAKAFIRQQDRIKRLEQAGDDVAAIIGPPGSAHWADENQVDAAWNNWRKAKEDKP